MMNRRPLAFDSSFRIHHFSLHPFVGDLRLDLDGNFPDVFRARSAHRLLDRLCSLFRVGCARLHNYLVVDYVDD